MSTATRVVHQVASLSLSYPDGDLPDRLPMIDAALAENRSDDAIGLLRRFVRYLSGAPLSEAQRHYVEVFDFDRRHALHLSYWTDGDTRRRGEVLADFKARYRASGWMVRTQGELPDYLPMVLEFAALVDPDAGLELMIRYRASIELIRLGLESRESPYADVLAAICATLPGSSPHDRAAAMALAQAAPPFEQVGLEPYDPRLLPLEERP